MYLPGDCGQMRRLREGRRFAGLRGHFLRNARCDSCGPRVAAFAESSACRAFCSFKSRLLEMPFDRLSVCTNAARPLSEPVERPTSGGYGGAQVGHFCRGERAVVSRRFVYDAVQLSVADRFAQTCRRNRARGVIDQHRDRRCDSGTSAARGAASVVRVARCRWRQGAAGTFRSILGLRAARARGVVRRLANPRGWR